VYSSPIRHIGHKRNFIASTQAMLVRAQDLSNRRLREHGMHGGVVDPTQKLTTAPQISTGRQNICIAQNLPTHL
jgi:hypothetical protein